MCEIKQKLKINKAKFIDDIFIIIFVLYKLTSANKIQTQNNHYFLVIIKFFLKIMSIFKKTINVNIYGQCVIGKCPSKL